MKFEQRKYACIELICFSILSLLPLKGSSLEFMDSSPRKQVGNEITWKGRNKPTIFDIQDDETNEYYDLNNPSRYKRSIKGKLF